MLELVLIEIGLPEPIVKETRTRPLHMQRVVGIDLQEKMPLVRGFSEVIGMRSVECFIVAEQFALYAHIVSDSVGVAEELMAWCIFIRFIIKL